ncbi:MAG: hypothetical protein EOO47_22230 [Flavobacterium sp.]|nr:MAG: hypothetical protein EOO47_22230 [Flavobacterium sp.]
MSIQEERAIYRSKKHDRGVDYDEKGACQKGYYWIYHPLDGILLFNYSHTRWSSAPLTILDSLRVYLNTKGYAVYQKYFQSRDKIHLACWAHGCREFE